jgi:hypothetical protein
MGEVSSGASAEAIPNADPEFLYSIFNPSILRSSQKVDVVSPTGDGHRQNPITQKQAPATQEIRKGYTRMRKKYQQHFRALL